MYRYFQVGCAQGHLNMQPGGSGNETTDPAIHGQSFMSRVKYQPSSDPLVSNSPSHSLSDFTGSAPGPLILCLLRHQCD